MCELDPFEDPDYIGQFKEMFEANLNKFPSYILDLNYNNLIYENVYRSSNIRNLLGTLLLTVLNNPDYVEILLDKGFVNFNLEQGNLKITNFANDYGIENSIKQILQIITRMNIEIVDNKNNSIIDAYIEYIYDKNNNNGDVYIELGDSVYESLVYSDSIVDQYLNADIMKKSDILDLIRKKNNELFESLLKIQDVVGNMENYLESKQKRSIFIIDSKNKE